MLEYAQEILKEGELPSMNITVQDEVPQELIDKMCNEFSSLISFAIEKMGLDIDKIKVKKDTKDAQ